MGDKMTAQQYYNDVWIKEHTEPTGDWPFRFAEAYAASRASGTAPSLDESSMIDEAAKWIDQNGVKGNTTYMARFAMRMCAYWESRATTAELKVLTFREEIAKRAASGTEGREALTCDWVSCPICGEPDMKKTMDADGNALIYCVNHECASNGGSNAEALAASRSGGAQKEKKDG